MIKTFPWIMLCLLQPSLLLAQTPQLSSDDSSKSLEEPSKKNPSSESTSQPDEKDYFLEGREGPLMNSTLNYLDSVHSWLGGYVDDLGEEADDFFGTDDSFDRTRGSRLDIMFPVRFHANWGIDTQIKFRAKVALPRTNKRWHLMVSSAEDTLQELANDEQGSSSSAINNNTSATSTNQDGTTAVGFRFLLETKDFTESYFDFGLNFRNIVEPDPYVRVKGTYKWQLTKKWYSRMYQDLFWENYDGAGLNSRQIFDYQVNNRYLWRSETNGTWWDKDQYYDLSHNFIFFDRVNVHRGLAYHLGWNWNTQAPSFHLTAYHTGVNWRERIYKKWLFFEIEPRVDFREDTNFQTADPSILFMLEAQFYDDSKQVR
ncbi:MAG: hypothetical protein HUJ13_01890 [Hydrogenovibrio crunogenus]|nr:hypothetical protein [Hydrogenovibrio crunogenus]